MGRSLAWAHFTGLLLVALCVLGPMTVPQCVASESRLIRNVLAAKPAGAVIKLGEGGRVTALHLEPTEVSAVGGIVILHAADGHFNNAGPVRALRTRLPQHGWHTLSVQLPALSSGVRVWHRRSSARLALGVNFFGNRDVGNVVIIAHGAAAGAAARYFSDGAAASVTGFIAVSPVYLRASVQETPGELSNAWPKRLLEVYGERDFPGVRRHMLAHAQQRRYLPELSWSSIEIAAGRHGLKQNADEVLGRIKGWLERHMSGR